MPVNSMQICEKQTRVVIQIILLEAFNPLENGGLSQSAWIDPLLLGALGQSKGMEGLSKMLYLLPIFYDP